MRLAAVLVLLALAPGARAAAVAEVRDSAGVRTAGGAAYYEAPGDDGAQWIWEAGPGRPPAPVARLAGEGDGACEPSDIAACRGTDVSWEVSPQRVAIRRQATVSVKGFIEPFGGSFEWGPVTGPLEQIEACNGAPYYPFFELDADVVAYRDHCEGFEPRVRRGAESWVVPMDSGEPVGLAGDWVAVRAGLSAPTGQVGVFNHATRTSSYTVELGDGSPNGVTPEGELVAARTTGDPACPIETSWYSPAEPVAHRLACGVSGAWVGGGRALITTAPGVLSVTDVPGTPTVALTAEAATLGHAAFDGQHVVYVRASCTGHEVAIFDVAVPETYTPGPNPCGAAIRTGRPRLRGKRVFIRVRCAEACRGNLVLSGVGSSGPTRIGAGRTRRVGVSVRRRVRRELRRGEPVRVDAELAQRGLQPAGRRVTLRPPRRR